MIIRIVQPHDPDVRAVRYTVQRRLVTFLDAYGPDEALPPPTAEEKVVIALSPQILGQRSVSLALRDRRKIRDILPLELKGELVEDPADLIFDALLLATGEALAFWIARDRLKQILAAETAAPPEIASCAPAEWGALLPETEKGAFVALSDGTAIAVFKDAELCYYRSLGSETGREIERTLAALDLSQGITVSVCYLFGQASDHWQKGPEGFPLTARILPPNSFVQQLSLPDDASRLHLSSSAALAYAVVAGSMLNFMQGELASTKSAESFKKGVRLSAILALLIIIALFSEIAIRWQFITRDLRAVDRSITGLYKEVFPERKAVDEAAELKAEIRRLSGSGGDAGALTLLKSFAEGMNDGVIGFTEIEVDAATVRARGDARSLQAVNDLKSRLAPAFTDLAVTESRIKPNGEVSFALRGNRKGGKP